MIHDVKTKKLKVIPDDRGRLMEMLRNDDECFEEFGQVYLSTTYPGVVKAWHYHKLQKDNFVCVKGMVKLVLCDTREGSPTKGEIAEFVIGEHNPVLVQVPIGVYHGWKCIGHGGGLRHQHHDQDLRLQGARRVPPGPPRERRHQVRLGHAG